MTLVCLLACLSYAYVRWLTRIWIVQGKTVLMFAIEAKMEALIYKLIEMGADIHAKTVCSFPLLPSHLPQLRETHSDVMVWGYLGASIRDCYSG